MFLERMQSSRRWERACERVRLNRALQEEADEGTNMCLMQSASIFRPGLEKPLWAVLASSAGLMPPEVAHAVPREENFEYQEPPWEVRNGERVVKGTSRTLHPDESGGLATKYAALFDGRPDFDSLRVSFLHAACGKRLQRLEDSLGEYLEREETTDDEAIAAVLEYLEQCRGHFDVSRPVSDSPAGFAQEAWSLLVECMCEEGRHFS